LFPHFFKSSTDFIFSVNLLTELLDVNTKLDQNKIAYMFDIPLVNSETHKISFFSIVILSNVV